MINLPVKYLDWLEKTSQMSVVIWLFLHVYLSMDVFGSTKTPQHLYIYAIHNEIILRDSQLEFNYIWGLTDQADRLRKGLTFWEYFDCIRQFPEFSI